MTSPTLTRVGFSALLVLATFSALSAMSGGVAMLLTNGLGMPSSFLDHSPFNSFAMPAVILLLVVGGTQGFAAVLLFARHPSALLWSAVAGLALNIWILVETAIIRGFGFLQALYFFVAVAELVLVLGLLGVTSGLPDGRRAPDSGRLRG